MKFLISALFITHTISTYATSLSDYRPYKYEVLFTNPLCQQYLYPTPVQANDGSELLGKPKNVYCKPGDLEASAKRPTSPQYRLIEWINDSQTREIFMAYLSFSNKDITEALCGALKKGVKLNIVLDQNPDEGDENSAAEGLKKCGDITIHYRGNRGGLGYAHNKVFIVNPNDTREMKIVFSSGNMSTGTAIHHENWNFITTSPKSYFAQAHLCLKNGMINHGDTKKDYVSYIAQCKSEIKSPEESDIQTYFVPGEGAQAFNALSELAKNANRVDAVAHRFSGIFVKLFSELVSGKNNVRLVTDDDMYWSFTLRVDTGRNTSIEAYKIKELVAAGLDIKYMETNHNSVLLQHNKFMFFEMGARDAVFAGAGNFTSSAFDKNYENFYIITIPEVTRAFEAQYAKFWDEMATPVELMPKKNVMP